MTTKQTKTIAFLGLGAMGSRMAQRLVDAGYPVAVWNRTPARAAFVVACGARLAETPRDAARGSDVVISMVRGDDASRSVWLDPQRGALAGLADHAVAIESSTLTPRWVDTLAASMADRRVAFIDAPVAGSRPQAEAGQLIYLAGGASDVVDDITDVLLAMGGVVHHCGPTGSGATVKLAVNALFGIQVAALSELLGLTRRRGINDAHSLNILGALPITSPALKGIGALMTAKKFAPMFPIDLVEKDFGYVEQAAADVAATVPTTAAVRTVYAAAKQRGLADDNITGLIKLFE